MLWNEKFTDWASQLTARLWFGDLTCLIIGSYLMSGEETIHIIQDVRMKYSIVHHNFREDTRANRIQRGATETSATLGSPTFVFARNESLCNGHPWCTNFTLNNSIENLAMQRQPNHNFSHGKQHRCSTSEDEQEL